MDVCCEPQTRSALAAATAAVRFTRARRPLGTPKKTVLQNDAKHANTIPDAVLSDDEQPPRLMVTSLLNRLRNETRLPPDGSGSVGGGDDGGGDGGGERVRGPYGPPVVLPPPPPPPGTGRCRRRRGRPRPIATDRARTAGLRLSRFHDARAYVGTRDGLPPSGGGDHIVVSCTPPLVCVT